MPYIPEEHKQYPVLPYCREHGGEVFQYYNWPEEELEKRVGEHLIPYGYNSYEEYFEKIDRLIKEHSDDSETVRLLEKIKKNISEWNHKEDWSICRFIGDNIGEVMGLRNGGYYYWPCTASDPTFSGVIDEEEFTAYQFPTDSNLWEIVVDPTGMAYRTIYEGIDSLSQQSFNYMMEQVRNLRPEDMTNVETLGPVPRLNDCKVIRVRVIETIDKNNAQGLIPGEEHDATILENGQLLIGDGTGRARIYPVDLFEVIPLGVGDTEMKKQIITINGKNISIPEYYQKVDSMPDDPEGAIPYMVQTENAMCFALIFPEDESKSLPRNKESLIAGIRQFLGENQGLIQVETADDHVYSIVKTLNEPSGVQYILTYQKFYPEFILNIQAFFEEIGTTGMRDSLVYGWCRKQNLVGTDADPLAGWTRDPYDETIGEGALMNLSELEQFDEQFPGFPLTMCREFISTLDS